MNAQKQLPAVGIALALGSLIAASTPVFAQTVSPGPDPKVIPGDGYYLSLGIGGTHRAPAKDRTGPSTKFKQGYVVSGEVGRRFGIIRVGAETNYFNNVNNIETVPQLAALPSTVPAGTLGTGEKAMGNIGLKTYFFNVYADIPTKMVRLKPYVGVGLGIFQSQVNGLSSATLMSGVVAPTGTIGNAAPVTILQPTVVSVSSNFQTAYQFKLGVAYAVDSKTEIFLGYRKMEGQRFKLATTTLGTLDVGGPNVDTFEAGVRVSL